MRDLLEKWTNERVRLLVMGPGGIVGFEGKLQGVNDRVAVIGQDDGGVLAVRYEEVIAVVKIPAVLPAKLELPGRAH